MNDISQDDSKHEPMPKMGMFSKLVEGSRALRQTIKLHPVWSIVYAGVVMVLGFFSSVAFDYTKSMLIPTDQYLIKIRDEQSKQYEDLKKGLSDLKGSIDSSASRSAFKSVDEYSKKLVESNKNLLSQLELAKQENETLSQAAQKNGKVTGGYDFILNKGSGMQIDESTVIGVETIYPNRWTTVNITASYVENGKNKISLNSGESIVYKNANGRSCKVTVLTIARDAVSFGNYCD